MKTVLSLLMILMSQVVASEDKVYSLAVLELENRSSKYQSFVNAIPDMLITELIQIEGLKLVERTKVSEALKAMKIEKEELTKESHVKVGEWLGADQILIGSFSKILGDYRMDIRIIDVRKGTINFAAASMRKEKFIVGMIKDLGQQIRDGFLIKKDKGRSISSLAEKWNPGVPSVKKKLVNCKIEFKMKLGVFTERSFPIQMVRLWVDNELIGTSEPIKVFNKNQLIIDAEIPIGSHEIRLEHGMMRKNGKWLRAFEEQPNAIRVIAKKGKGIRIKYEEKIYDHKESFSSLHEML